MTQKWFKKQLSVWASVASGRARILIIRMFVMGTESTFVVWRNTLSSSRVSSVRLIADYLLFVSNSNTVRMQNVPTRCNRAKNQTRTFCLVSAAAANGPLIGSVTSWAAVEAVRAHAVTSWLPCNIQGGRNTDIFRRSPYPIGGDSACEHNYL